MQCYCQVLVKPDVNWRPIKGVDCRMSKVMTAEELRNAIGDGAIIQNGSRDCAEGIKYDFRMGSRFLKAYFGRPIDFQDIKSAEEMKRAVVEPGEVVFIMSRERVKLPDDVYIQLNPKRSLSQDGIELLGGLTVDPGYEGYLVFGLRNVAGKPYHLKEDTKIVGALFFRLTESELVHVDAKPSTIDDFPQRLQELIEKYEPVNPQNLAEELQNLKHSFEERQIQVADDVKQLKNQVDAFSKDLVRQAAQSESEAKQLDSRLSDMSSKLDGLSRDNVETRIGQQAMKESLDSVVAQTAVLKDGAAIQSGEKRIRSIVVTAIVTFVLTVIAGILVNLLRNMGGF